MAIYELRTYTLFVGKIQEASEIYKKLGTPWINKFKKNLVNYYLGDIGALNQLSTFGNLRMIMREEDYGNRFF